MAGPGRHGHGRLTQRDLQLDPFQHLGRGGPDGTPPGHFPARARPRGPRDAPEGDAGNPAPHVAIEPVAGAPEKVPYDFLINATGPRLRFDKTEGLGPDGHSLSVCTVEHAVQTSTALDEAVERMRRGERQRFLVGVGHGTCTCEGAAFEYIVNLEFELRFAMLLPPFSGAGLRAYDQQGDDITGRLFLANDFIRVDADYGAGPYQE